MRSISTKLLIGLLTIVFSNSSLYAQTNGIYESYAIMSINGGANAYYDMAAATPNPDFQGANLGSFNNTQSLVVIGGQNKTFKCSGGDISGGSLKWRVWLTSAGPSGAFNSISYGFVSNDAGGCGGNQTWEGTGGVANIIASLTTPGNYTLEVYSDATGVPGTASSNNSGNNYRATFTYCGPTAGPLPAGNYAIPGCFATVASAINYINANGVTGTGNVQFDVAAGYTETAPVGGFVISATGTATLGIVFTKAGAGANPTFTAGLQVAGSISDGIFKIIGGDYITISNFTLQENAGNTVTVVNNTTNTMTEFGIGLFPAATGTVDGAQNNTIQNNIISLNAVYGQSMGIFSTSRSKAAAIATTADATTSAGLNSNNKIYGNTISNVALGMYFLSPTTTSSLMEVNDIGGTSNATGNTITFGSTSAAGTFIAGASATYSAGIMFRSGVGSNVRYNTITSSNLAYSNVSGGVLGIYFYGNGTAPTSGTYTSNASNNIITLTNTAVTPIIGIDFGAGIATGSIAASSNNISITSGSTAANAAVITGIRAPFTSSSNTITSNTVSINQSGTGTWTGSLYFINADGNASTMLVQNNNLQSTGSHIKTTGSVYGISHSGTISTSINIGGSAATANTINITSTGSGASFYGIYSNSSTAASVTTYNVSYNSITGTSLAGSSTSIYGIYNGDGGSPVKNISNNTISISGTNTGTNNGIFFGYSGSGSIVNSNTITLNTAAVTLNGISTMSNAVCGISSNTIAITTSGTTPTAIGINTTAGTGPFTISNNAINSIVASAVSTSAPTLTGIRNSIGTNNVISNNTIKDISTGASTGVANVTGIEIRGGTTPSVYNNNLYNISALSSGNNSLASGIGFQTATPTGPFNVYNNFISDIRLPNATATAGSGGIFAINGASTGSTYRIYYNTIKLGSTASPLTVQANSRIVGAGFLSTTANQVDLRNNIININANSITTGFSSCVALTGVTPTAGTVSTIFATTSNNNIYYINPTASNYLYVEGATVAAIKNGYALSGLTASAANNIVNDPAFNTSCGLYKTFMGGSRETATFSEDNLGVVSTGTFAPSGASFAENGAQSIASPSITTDFAGVSRTPTNDIGALQFAGTATDAVAPTITYTSNPSGTVVCTQTVTATITDASGVNNTTGTKPRLYFKKSTEANAFGAYPGDNTSAFNGWKYVETSSSGSPYSFTFNFSLLSSALASGDVINYFVTAQDMATTPNVGTLTATIIGGCPTSVNFANTLSATSANSFTYSTPSTLTINASTTAICNSGTSTLSITSTPVLSNVTYQWEESTTGAVGSFSNATGTSTNATYTTPTISSTMYYRVRVFCNGTEISASPSAAISITVTSPSITGTTPGSRCGTGTVNLAATGSAGTILNWYAGLSGGLVLGSGATFTTPSISTNTNFYVSASVTGPLQTGTIGSGTSLTSATSQPTAFCNRWSYYRMQYIYTAAELTAAGLSAGTIQSIAYNIASLGDAASNAAFTVSIGNTALTTFSTFVNSGLTTVYGPASYTHAASGWQTITFSTPYSWDGVSNIIVEVSHNGANLTNNSTTYYTTTGSSMGGYTTTSGGTATATTNRLNTMFTLQSICSSSPRTAVLASIVSAPTITVSNASPISVCNAAIIQYQITSTLSDYDNYTWTATGGNLYTDAAGTVAYVAGSNATNIYFVGTTPGAATITANANNTVTGCIATAVTKNITVLPASVTATASPSNICNSGTSTISLTPSTASFYTNATIQWQSSPDGSTGWTNISGANAVSYTTPTLSTTSYYRATVTNSAGAVCLTSNVVTITVNNPQVLTTTPGTRCGTGTVNLSATGSAGTNLNWYAAATGGTPLGTGTTFTTPSIAGTTTYYVGAATAPVNITLGLTPTTTTCGTIANSTSSSLALRFNTTAATTLVSVDVIANAAGSYSFSLRNALSSTDILTSTQTLVAGAQTVTLNWAIPTSGNYQVLSTTANLHRIATYSCTYPFVSPSGAVSIVGSAGTSTAATATTTYNCFFNLVFAEVCESPRTAVAATVTASPTLAISNASPISVCNGAVTQYQVTSTLSDYDNYTWTATGGNLFTDAAGTVAYVAGSNANPIYFVGTTPGAATITANANNTVTGCIATAVTKNITVLPASITAAASPASICVSGTSIISLSPNTAASYSNATIQWQSSPDGSTGWTDIAGANAVTYTTPPLIANAYYRAIVANSAGANCLTSNVATVTVNNPQVLTTTPGTRCGTGTVNLGATGSAGTTLNWYAAATGGTVLGTGATFTTPSIAATTNYFVSAGVASSGNITVGTASTTNSSNGQTPFSQGYEGQHTQYLYTAADLAAAGLMAGNITAMSYFITTKSSTKPYTSYTIKLAHTAATSLTGILTPTFTTVYTSSATVGTGYTTVAGVNNFNFATSFNWDGTSNLLIDVCFANDPLSSGTYWTSNDAVRATTKSYTATYGYYSDNGANCGATIGSSTSTTALPDIVFAGQTACSSSPRTSVTATVNTATAITVSNASPISVCNGSATQYQITSTLSDYDSYTWTVTGGILYTDATLSTPITAGNSYTSVYFSSTTTGTATITVNASNSVSGCVATAITKNITVLPASIVAAASPATICVSGTTTITLTPNTAASYSNATIQWQSSPDGSTGWTDIAGANAVSYTTATIATVSYYRAIVTNSAGSTCLTSNVVTINVNNPTITGTTPASRCGIGTVTLGATGSTGTTVNWYAAATGGSSLGTGNSFVTPVINATTTYYAQASIGSANVTLGLTPTTSTCGTITMPSFSDYPLRFNTTATTTLVSVDVTASAAGSYVFKLRASGSTTDIISTTLTLTAGTQTVPLNWSIPAAGNYQITSTTSALSRISTYTCTYPFTSPSGAISIVGSATSSTASTSTTSYSSFYNLVFNESCATARTAVTATVTSPPALSLSSSTVDICAGTASDPVTLTSVAASFDTYSWNPTTGVSGNQATGWTFNPATNTTYTLTASQSGGSMCVNQITVPVTVKPIQGTISVSPTTASVCAGASQTLNATATTSQITILSENFETFSGTTMANGWISINNSTGGTPAFAAWDAYAFTDYYYDGFDDYYFNSSDNSKVIVSNSDYQGGGTTSTILRSPAFSTMNMNSATLSFEHFYNDVAVNSGDDANVEISDDNSTWTSLAQYLTDQGTEVYNGFYYDDNLIPVTINIPAAFLNKPNVYIRFRYSASYDWWWAIDNVSVKGTPSANIAWVANPAAGAGLPVGAGTPSTTNSSIVINPTQEGTVLYTASFTGPNGCKVSATSTITVTANQWVGPATGGDWNVAANWCGGVPTASTNVIIPGWAVVDIKTANAVANSVTIQAPTTASGINMMGAYNLTISSGGSITNNGAFNATTSTGSVIFAGAGTVSGTTTFQNVLINGGVNFGTNATIGANGSLTINAGGYVNANPVQYDCTATLIYNTGNTVASPYGIGTEWTGASSGKGYPGNIKLSNNTVVNFANGNLERYACGNLTIDAGSALYMDFGTPAASYAMHIAGNVLVNGNISLGNNNGGDLYIAGNWTRGVAPAMLYANGRAIIFNGTSATQTITRTNGGIEDRVDYMTVNKPSGNVAFAGSPSATSVILNAASGNVLQLLSGNIDLNGQSLSFNNAGGNILVQGGVRTITGATGSKIFYNGYKTVTALSSGTLVTDINVVNELNAGVNFGASVTTVNGTLQLNSGSFVDINAPYYGTASLLKYNNTGTYDRRVEWSGLNPSSPGYPNDVLVTNNTTLQPGGPGSPGTFTATPFNTLRNVTIDAGSAIYMDATNKVMTVPMRVGGTLTISGALSASSVVLGDIYVGKDWVRNTGGSFNHNTRAVFFNSAQNSIITASGAGEKFAYLYIDKNATANTVTTLDSVSVSRELGFPRGTYDLAASHTTLKSTDTHTARVGQITGNALINYSGIGRFIIERYVKTPYNWDLMSIPADSTQTVKNAWAEGNAAGVPGIAGLGTNITGPGGAPNFDFSSPGYSMKYWDEVLQKFQVVTKKDTAIYNPRGYYIFVRGDRNAMAGGPYNNTVLRTKGRLFINPSINYLIPGRPNSVGNPLVSELDFKLLNYAAGTLSPSTKIYLWDPTLNGSYGVGAYQTLTYNGTNFTITPGSLAGGAYPTTGSVYNNLQSGQAFYIEDPTMTGITFPESAKTNGLTTTVTRTSPDTWQHMSVNLLAVNNNNEDKLIDGVSADFSSDFANAVDAEDAGKFNNSAENVSLYRDSKKLSVERHFTINNNDTMHIRIENMRQRNYHWQIDFGGRNIGTIKAYLGDRYLATETALDMNNVNDLSFTVNSNAATATANRFYIIFKQQVVLPVTFVSIAAQRQPDRSIKVNWEVANETNIQKYEVERSADGRNFTGILNSDATNSRQYTKNDLSPLAADNFYRIKAIGIAGDITYSAVVKVAPEKQAPFIAVQPNPVVGKRLNVVFGNQPPGEYMLQLNNNLGQLIHRSSVAVSNNSAIKTIVLSPITDAGSYRLTVYNKAGELVSSEAVIIQ